MKYKNVKVKNFDSKLESAVADMLNLLVKGKKISDLKYQVPVFLSKSKIKTIIDFSYVNTKTGQLEFSEAKGFETQRFKIIKQLWKFYGTGELTIWKGSYKNLHISEVVKPLCYGLNSEEIDCKCLNKN